MLFKGQKDAERRAASNGVFRFPIYPRDHLPTAVFAPPPNSRQRHLRAVGKVVRAGSTPSVIVGCVGALLCTLLASAQTISAPVEK